jgi:2-oxoisovalerate dehydrogenase E1 component alpha subunit
VSKRSGRRVWEDAEITDIALLRRIYDVALVTRAVDERLWILTRQGRAGFVLTARGHEIAQIASAVALRPGHDSAWLYYRDLGVGLALGVTPYELFLGALARADDPHSGGRQLTAHLSDNALRIGSVSSEVGAHVPHAVGAAYAARVKNEDSVAVCWFGDGAASEGGVHEAMNLAGVHELPVVFLCENNGYAISVPLDQQMPITTMEARAAAYGFAGASVDGCDAEAVHEATTTAITRARNKEGPTLIDMSVPRIVPHSSQDDDSYRDADEKDAASARDPIPRLRALLIERNALDPEEDEVNRKTIEADVLAAAEQAFARPEPTADRARKHLYAEEGDG